MALPRGVTPMELPLLNLKAAGCPSADDKSRRRLSAPPFNQSSASKAPVIQISTEAVPTSVLESLGTIEGIDNQAFVNEILDELRADQDGLLAPREASATTATKSTGIEHQKLTVPSTGRRRRRHSISLSLEDSFSIDGDESIGGYKFLTEPLSPGALSTKSNWSELQALARKDSAVSIGSYHSDCAESRYSITGISSAMSQRIKELVSRFVSRTEHFKEKAIQPPTPSSSSLGTHSALSGASEMEPEARQKRLESFVPVSSEEEGDADQKAYFTIGRFDVKVPQFIRRFRKDTTIDPNGRIYLFWLFLLTSAFTYNAVAIPLRATFTTSEFYHPGQVTREEIVTVCNDTSTAADSSIMTCYNETRHVTRDVTRYYPGVQSESNRRSWWIVDYICDMLYLLDILLVRIRMSYINEGMPEKDKKKILLRYFKNGDYKMDFLSIVPLDVLYLIPALCYNPIVRCNRLLKVRVMWELYDKLDTLVKSSHFVRIARTLTYMLFLIHLESCVYYAVSAYEKLGFNDWVYNGDGTAYVHCMYLATKTATSIGNNPKPENLLEYLFMTVYWLSGVFVFAMLIGQIRDIFTSANAAKDHYKKTMDKTLEYMGNLSLPKQLQDRIRSWFIYNWEHQKTLNENSLLEALPMKMKADLCIHVHFNTLSKVQLFQDCEKNLLLDLVLKLNPVLYLPGDYICKKGEVGTEMYIVMHGHVEVVGGPDNSIVFATLYEGSVFGEISLLALTGGNRRTADVRSKGFSQLFILSKVDFHEAMSNYPTAQAMLKRRAKKLLAQNAKKIHKAQVENEEVIKSHLGTPRLVHTLVQVVGSQSNIPNYLGMQRQSRPHANSPHHSDSHPDLKILDDDDFEEELLMVETTERPLTAAEMLELCAPEGEEDAVSETVPEKRSRTAPPETVRQLSPGEEALEDLARVLQTSAATLNSDVGSLLTSPPPLRHKKTLPTMELETESKVSSPKTSLSDPLPDKEIAHGIGSATTSGSRGSSLSSTSSITLRKNNKVSPAVGSVTGKGLPHMSPSVNVVSNNQLMCQAEVHNTVPRTNVEPSIKPLSESYERKRSRVIVAQVSDEDIQEATDIIEQAIVGIQNASCTDTTNDIIA